ncbi:TetR family transcriptional regulator [Haloactinopolyspora alba]|uniref:TetR family transcriptional regulator n=1 Tax=Haloactinopolyspora alba TaxID=648780 RepID=A0A2P8DZY6_9ACTN|nr:TetR/AcrR family transcriptional regulator [Haloactinopolyspora alba]PSL02774.1 TetR family transcriptional regulator [Haloactinopolyspora alba]
MARPREFDPDTVVDAAMNVFWDGGYTATSTDDLCEGTGVGRSSLYNTFTSKRELYGKALRRYGDRTRSAQAELVERTGPVRPIIRDFLTDALEAQLADPGRRGCLALNAAVEVGNSDDDVAALVRDDFETIVETMRALIERGQRTGEIAADRDAHALARLTHSALTGIHVVGRVTARREHLTDIVDALVDSL